MGVGGRARPRVYGEPLVRQMREFYDYFVARYMPQVPQLLDLVPPSSSQDPLELLHGLHGVLRLLRSQGVPDFDFMYFEMVLLRLHQGLAAGDLLSRFYAFSRDSRSNAANPSARVSSRTADVPEGGGRSEPWHHPGVLRVTEASLRAQYETLCNYLRESMDETGRRLHEAERIAEASGIAVNRPVGMRPDQPRPLTPAREADGEGGSHPRPVGEQGVLASATGPRREVTPRDVMTQPATAREGAGGGRPQPRMERVPGTASSPAPAPPCAPAGPPAPAAPAALAGPPAPAAPEPPAGPTSQVPRRRPRAPPLPTISTQREVLAGMVAGQMQPSRGCTSRVVLAIIRDTQTQG
jgi:hypothetical protein